MDKTLLLQVKHTRNLAWALAKALDPQAVLYNIELVGSPGRLRLYVKFGRKGMHEHLARHLIEDAQVRRLLRKFEVSVGHGTEPAATLSLAGKGARVTLGDSLDAPTNRMPLEGELPMRDFPDRGRYMDLALGIVPREVAARASVAVLDF